MSSHILRTCLIFIILSINSCTDQGDYKNRYIIENATERTVTIKFYERQRLSEPKLVLTKEIDGPGIMYDEIKNLVDVSDRESPEVIFAADSLAVIFDNKKIQAHYESLPFGNSLAFFSDYIQEGDTKRYIITEENYQNALECNGECD